ncbi:EamA family transporter [Apilactobacillus micheneri]|uniref:EamA family transporter n=1 Tax=Apilactobacillus micheneri TaxID=1899430 RepID=A0ABY2YW73_9LACO|nr:DMT family transporter [Apilactobacillus micheneri]TPR24593.1 EamA family transporter [Apilactobacillus micheneri]TPR25904.1 EamA family transporter [Apilactobacillus micheneri]TPR28094.1 EamA family transporter [Apilactobacillus micheneri]TPR29585.1 EamA family transporter [Apilactobacillus micheneri]TPR30371.1 EamA family transporter [Apilactobacillus micheneri]
MNNEKGVLETNVLKGIFWAFIASALWGVSGTVLQFVSQQEKLEANWFLSTRTMIAGIILLVISAIVYKGHIFNVFGSWKSFLCIVAYGVFGIGANLYTFFMSVQTGNADASTILQYLSPLFILLGSMIFQKRKPLPIDVIVFVIAISGIILSLTQGDFSKLSISMESLIWGILSGVTAALYVVLPRPIVKTSSPMVILGWGTLISGIIFNIRQPLWVDAPHLTTGIVLGVGAIILLGTILPFIILLHSLNFAPSEVVSLVDATQPVVTFILSIIFFNTGINLIKIIGALLVILAIFVLQNSHRKLTIDKHSEE